MSLEPSVESAESDSLELLRMLALVAPPTIFAPAWVSLTLAAVTSPVNVGAPALGRGHAGTSTKHA